MAITANEIDRILQAAPTRGVNPANAAILLTASTPAFHVATGGAFDPATITFTASLVGIEGAITFAGVGCTVTTAGNVATLTYVNLAGATATVTASVVSNGVTVTSNVCTVTKIIDGVNGTNGINGTNGTPVYTWIKYGTSALGAGLSDSPTGMTYIGLAYNKSTAVESITATDYEWSLIKGTDGVAGTNGVNGATTYTWIKYADVADGTGLYDIPTAGTLYIGIATNKTVATESTVNTDYTWSLFKGGQGVAGTNGTNGTNGARGAGNFYAAGAAWSDVAADAATPGANVIDDQVVISNGTFSLTKRWTGTAWVVPGVYLAGDVFVDGSITAPKIITNGMIVRDSAGVAIIGLGVPLAAGYEAVGTKNSDQSLGALGYAGALNATADIDLVASGAGLALSGNTVTRAFDGGWTAGVRSRNANKGGSACSFTPAIGTIAMAGLNSDPTTNDSFETIDYAWYADATNNMYIFLNGTGFNGGSIITTHDGSNVFSVTDDGSKIRFLRDGAVWIEIDGPTNATLAFDSSIRVGTLKNIRFQAMSGVADGVSALAAVNHATTGLATKLNAAAASTLTGTVTISTAGSILAGTTTNGSYHSPSGFFGVQGGVVKFSVPTSGDPTFAGQLSAAYGSFGAVTIAAGGSISSGQTAYNTGIGWHLSFIGGVPKLSIGNPTGNRLTFDGTTMEYVGGVQLPPFSVSIAGTLGNTAANGASTYSGLKTATVSGGRAPLIYDWRTEAYGDIGVAVEYSVSSGQGTASAAFRGSATNDRINATITLTVTDADNRVATVRAIHFPIHGTYVP